MAIDIDNIIHRDGTGNQLRSENVAIHHDSLDIVAQFKIGVRNTARQCIDFAVNGVVISVHHSDLTGNNLCLGQGVLPVSGIGAGNDDSVVVFGNAVVDVAVRLAALLPAGRSCAHWWRR